MTSLKQVISVERRESEILFQQLIRVFAERYLYSSIFTSNKFSGDSVHRSKTRKYRKSHIFKF